MRENVNSGHLRITQIREGIFQMYNAVNTNNVWQKKGGRIIY